MAETKIPSIYRVPSNTEPELKRYLESVQEAVEVRLGRRGDELDQAVTYRDLIDSNLAQKASRLNRVIEPITEDPTPSMPFNTIPQNVKASGAFTKILVTWDNHQMGSLFARAEIWRSGVNDLNAATLQGSVYGSVFTDTVDYDTTMYYWVRFVQRATSVSGNETFGQFSSPAASATTAENISAVMTTLSETLADMPGYNLLSTTATAAVVIKSSSEPSTRVGGGALQVNDLWSDTDDGQLYMRNSANNAWVAARDATLVTTVNSLSSTVTSNSSSLATANSNIATLTTENTARATEIDNLEADVGKKYGGRVLTTSGSKNVKVETMANTANSTTTAAHGITSDDVTAGVFVSLKNISATGGLTAEQLNKTFKVTSRLSNSRLQVQVVGDAATSAATSATVVDGLTVGANAGLAQLATVTADIEGNAHSAYVMQVSANGSVAGMVLEAVAQDGVTATAVQFQADKFAIWNDSDGSTAPFIVSSNTVYIANAMIQDAAITNAKIANATIESAKIVSLSAAKISTGHLNSSQRITIGSDGTGATDQRIEISASGNRILIVDDSS